MNRLPSLALIVLALFIGCSSSRIATIPTYENVHVVNLGSSVNSAFDDYAPLLTQASRHLLFTSNRPSPQGIKHGDDFWSAERNGSGWSQAHNEETFNTEFDEGSACLSPDGSTVYFVECWTEDGLGDADIYTANVVNGKWEKIRNLGKGINTKYWDSMPFLSADGEELYFSSDRLEGYGGTDIYVSKWQRNGTWGEPKNLGPEINTSDDEKSPVLSPDGETLYFSSNGRGGVGGFDIWGSKLNRKKWTTPFNAGIPINSDQDELYFTITSEEDSLFIATRREGGLGGLDLWVADNNPFKDRGKYEYFIAGRVYDSATSRSLNNASVTIENKTTGEVTPLTSSINGFRLKTKPGTAYKIQASSGGYHPNEISFTVPEKLSYNEYRRNIPLSPTVIEKPDTTLRSFAIFFDFDKWDIRSDAEIALGDFLQYTKQFQIQEVLLDAHTDERGSEPYNIELSRKRGASVSKRLTLAGVPIEAISMTPHGELIPAASNESDEGRQQNRRVEIRLLGKRLPQP